MNNCTTTLVIVTVHSRGSKTKKGLRAKRIAMLCGCRRPVQAEGMYLVIRSCAYRSMASRFSGVTSSYMSAAVIQCSWVGLFAAWRLFPFSSALTCTFVFHWTIFVRNVRILYSMQLHSFVWRVIGARRSTTPYFYDAHREDKRLSFSTLRAGSSGYYYY